MVVTSAAIQLAQQEVARIQGECERLGALGVSQNEVNQASSRVQSIRALIDELHGSVPVRAAKAAYLTFLLLRLAFGHCAAMSGIPEWLLGICVSAFAFAVSLLVLSFCGFGFTALLISIMLLLICGGLILGIPPLAPVTHCAVQLANLRAADATKRVALAQQRERFRQATAEYERQKSLWDLQLNYRAAKEYLDRLLQQFNDRRNRLMAIDWRNLRGIDFERFLVDVFEMLGYTVQITKTTGDQGVDLLAVRGDVRLAIQAKGYTGSVGNSAVQEAFAGMAFYSCTRCAVITNSVFTSGAFELALKTNCLLIDGNNLPQLIAGRLL